MHRIPRPPINNLTLGQKVKVIRSKMQKGNRVAYVRYALYRLPSL